MTIDIERTVSLDGAFNPEILRGKLYQNEHSAHRFIISCTQNGSTVSLSGTVTARFIRADGETILLGNGATDGRQNYCAIEQGKATATLHPDCYHVPGRFKLSIHVNSGGKTICVYSVEGIIDRTETGVIRDSGEVIPSMDDIQAAARGIAGAELLDITQSKTGNVITVTTTDRTGTEVIKTITEPTAVVSKEQDGPYRIAITDANGTTQAEIPDPNAELVGLAQIDSLTTLRTATGNPITLNNAVTAKAKTLKVTLEPKQDLHGYDKPWVGGSGKNLLPLPFPYEQEATVGGLNVKYKDGTFTINGTTNGDGEGLYIPLITPMDFDASKYKLYLKSNGETAGAYFRTNTSTSYTHEINLRPANRVFENWATQPGDNQIVSVGIRALSDTGATINNLQITPMLLPKDASLPDAFEPYSNICPISGHSAVNVKRHGKNLWDDTAAFNDGNMSKNGDVYTNSYTDSRTDFRLRVQAVADNTPIFSSDIVTITSVGRFSVPITITDASIDKLRIKHHGTSKDLSIAMPWGETGTFIVSVDVTGYNPSTVGGLSITNIQVERGSTETKYEPSVQTLSIPLSSIAGSTVYGGTVTVNEDGSGTLVVDRACDTYDGSNDETWELRGAVGTRTNFRGRLSGTYIDRVDGAANHGIRGVLSNSLAVISDLEDNTYANSSVRLTTYETASNYIFVLIGADVNATTEAAFRSWLSNNPLQVSYPLATPASYPLTASQISTLIGTNHIWTDGTKIDLEYRGEKYAMLDKFLNALPSDTATGNPATFPDGADGLPMKQLTVDIQPKQDLHGYDKPWVGGAGKNLCAGSVRSETAFGLTLTLDDDGTFVATGTYTRSQATTYYDSAKTTTLPAGTYTLSGTPTGALGLLLRVMSGGSTLVSGNNTFTLNSETTVNVVLYVPASSSGIEMPTGGLKFSPMIRLATETDASFVPYENICPIEARDQIKVMRASGNMLDLSDPTKNFEITLPAGTYTIKRFNEAGDTQINSRIELMIDGTYQYIISGEYDNGNIVVLRGDVGWGNNQSQTILTKKDYRLRVIYNTIVALANHNAKLMMVPGVAIPTEYLPFVENSTLPISLKSITGSSVYGGTVKVYADGTGELVVDKVMKEYSSGWRMASNVLYIDDLAIPFDSKVYSCNGYPCNPEAQISAASNAQNYPKTVVNQHLTSDGSHTRWLVYDQTFTTADAFNSYIAENPLQIAYTVSPTTYPLSAPQLETLLGMNTVWCDAGQVTVEYCADTTKYIDKKLAEYVANALNA